MTDEDHDKIMAAVRDLTNHKPPAESIRPVSRGVARHVGKELHGFHVSPEQTPDFNGMAAEAGIDVEYRGGKCYANSRRAQQEWAYFRNQYVNRDGGYYETIKESRKRELDRLAGR
jgi:hypothetical protein